MSQGLHLMITFRQMKYLTAVALVCCALSSWADTGSLKGLAEDADKVRTVSAVNRAAKQTFSGSIDRATGRFIVGGLPLGASYDCIVEYDSGVVEGVDLRVPRSDYVEEQPLSDEDIATIQAKIRKMNQFEDVVEILAITGNIQHAAIVVNKLRTKPFYDSKPGEVVWRLELWHYERPEETWFKARDELSLVLYRERLPRAQYDQKCLTLDPALGGLTPTAETREIDVGAVVFPDKGTGITIRERREAPDGQNAAAVRE